MKPLEEMGKFATVVVDPPWPVNFGGGTPDEMNSRRRQKRARLGSPHVSLGTISVGPTINRYDSMSVEAITALDIGKVLADTAILYLWTIQRHLPASFDVLQGWGVRYAYTMTWHKPWGVKPAGYPAYNSEFVVVGHKGTPKYLDEKMFATTNIWPNPRSHSTKPEGFYDLLRRVTPGPRLDVFGRRRIAGFESWGNEAPEGPALPDHYQQVLHG